MITSEKKRSSFIWDDNPESKGNEGCINCGRYALVVSNVMFFVLGAFLLCFGVWFTFVPANQNLMTIISSLTTQSYVRIAMYLVEATGVCTIVLAIVGCCGAISNSKYIYGLFFLFLVVLFVQLMSVAGVSVWLRFRIESDISYQMQTSLMESYISDEALTRESLAWREIQSGFKCCGYSASNGYTDYANATKRYPDGSKWWQLHQHKAPSNKWPDSCCIQDVITKEQSKQCHLPKSPLVFTEGCIEKVGKFMNESLLVVTVIAILLGLIEILHFGMVRQLEAAMQVNKSSSKVTIFSLEETIKPPIQV